MCIYMCITVLCVLVLKRHCCVLLAELETRSDLQEQDQAVHLKELK